MKSLIRPITHEQQELYAMLEDKEFELNMPSVFKNWVHISTSYLVILLFDHFPDYYTAARALACNKTLHSDAPIKLTVRRQRAR